MPVAIPKWDDWLAFFAARTDRPMPELGPKAAYLDVPPSVAKSLAIFQLGESGGGTIIGQALGSTHPQVTRPYGEAMRLFVEEEHRHADILANCVRALDGSLIKKNWTARLFVFGRRLIGLRLKVLVLLAAEVVGICYYQLIASRLPGTNIETALSQIVCDERAHLYFHCDFLRSQASDPIRRSVFLMTWRAVMFAAAIVVFIDHRKAMADLGVEPTLVWRTWMSHSRFAERLVTGREQTLPVAALMKVAANR